MVVEKAFIQQEGKGPHLRQREACTKAGREMRTVRLYPENYRGFARMECRVQGERPKDEVRPCALLVGM